MYSVTYVQKGYMVSDLILFGIKSEYNINCSCNISTRCLISLLLVGLEFHLTTFILTEHMSYSPSPGIDK